MCHSINVHPVFHIKSNVLISIRSNIKGLKKKASKLDGVVSTWQHIYKTPGLIPSNTQQQQQNFSSFLHICLFCVGGPWYTWRSEENVKELVFFPRHVGSKSQTQVIKYGHR